MGEVDINITLPNFPGMSRSRGDSRTGSAPTTRPTCCRLSLSRKHRQLDHIAPAQGVVRTSPAEHTIMVYQWCTPLAEQHNIRRYSRNMWLYGLAPHLPGNCPRGKPFPYVHRPHGMRHCMCLTEVCDTILRRPLPLHTPRH